MASMYSAKMLLQAFMTLFLCRLIDFHWTSAANVSFDHRSLIIDGQRKLLLSASIHYPRSVPSMWPDLIAKAKEGGIDVIDTYVFWNGHEPVEGTYYFEDRFDLVGFVKTVQEAGLYVNLRIGPFVAAEWKFGGVPVWLHYVNGTIFRTNNEPFKRYMQQFTTYIVNLMKKEKLFASQGGPIILAQIENEYGDIEGAYGDGAKPYATWSANMALSQNTGVPWIMCQQYDTPEQVINTCNGFYCDQFTPNSDKKPKLWTENWTGWFTTFGNAIPQRPVEDIAFSVARFFQNGGSLQNYYMYHGGTNFGRTNGGPFLTTSYDYDAPIDEYGLLRQPKWGHLKDLHQAIKMCETTLLYGQTSSIALGSLQQATVYTGSGSCAAFLSNADTTNDVNITFQNNFYHLPAWSVSILPDCKNVAFNTAKVGAQSSVIEMEPVNLDIQWETYQENIGVWGDDAYTLNYLADQLNVTKASTDYLWYTISVQVDESEPFLGNGNSPTLVVESRGHVMHAFVNNEFVGSAIGNGGNKTFKYENAIDLKAGRNDIALLSMLVGLQNGGPQYDFIEAGISKVTLEGFQNGTIDLSTHAWTYQIGLKGEKLMIYSENGSANVQWQKQSPVPKNQSLTWYKARIDAPAGNDSMGLDMLSMGKGLAWLNGHMIGVYWPVLSSEYAGCSSQCDYRGKFTYNKCNTNCGIVTQRWYHIPRSWFKAKDNLLVILEDKGGDPTQIGFAKRRLTSVCGFTSEKHPKPVIHLECPQGSKISAINFASYGTPQGSCGAFQIGSCHTTHSSSVVEKECIGRQNCSVEMSAKRFGQDPCPDASKSLAVQASCT